MSTTPLLNEASVTGTSHDRAKAIHIENNPDGNVNVSYFEETLVSLSDGTIAIKPTGRPPLRTTVDLSRQVTLITGPNVGQKFKITDLYSMITSLYFEDHAAEMARLKAIADEDARFKANFATSMQQPMTSLTPTTTK